MIDDINERLAELVAQELRRVDRLEFLVSDDEDVRRLVLAMNRAAMRAYHLAWVDTSVYFDGLGLHVPLPLPSITDEEGVNLLLPPVEGP